MNCQNVFVLQLLLCSVAAPSVRILHLLVFSSLMVHAVTVKKFLEFLHLFSLGKNTMFNIPDSKAMCTVTADKQIQTLI